ncbi:MAG: DUF1707 domain-containing protein [Acidobacteriota bacterium]|nr:DUF1707 domain-containing protein [Acidobacteriota bacterium]
MAEAQHVRVSDQDREAAATALREHYAAGRLDNAEVEERLQAVYAARTKGELEALSADLPSLPLSPTQTRAMLAERRTEIRRRAVQNAGGSLAPFLVCTLIWAATGAGGFFWPAFLLIGPVALFARVGWALYGPAPDFDAAERHIRAHGQRDRGRRHRRHS